MCTYWTTNSKDNTLLYWGSYVRIIVKDFESSENDILIAT